MTVTQPEQSSTNVNVTALQTRIKPRRQIEGNSAILVPFLEDGTIDYAGLAAHIERTAAAGLRPCVNMDTGYVNLLTQEDRKRVLEVAQQTLGGTPEAFIAGAFIEGQTGDMLDLYRSEVHMIQSYGGLPIIFQSHALTGLDDETLVESYRQIAQECDRVLIFELGKMFAPFGAIYHLDTVRALMSIPQITGMKHSSLDRGQEWARLALRDEIRPDFKVYTGNDLAIDMVMYGSDYVLGLSTFAPEAFAKRDRLWAQGDSAFYQLNDLLQYLGFLAFRPPTPAYKHNAAQFLQLRGHIQTNLTHPNSPHRPESDIAILRDIAERLDALQ
jgi:dihydrodipicolinate synthase/N-acetylneuraminate lyase